MNGEDRRFQDPQVADAARRKDYEERFARSFILAEKRGRFVRLAVDREVPPKPDGKGGKRRSKFRMMINNLEHWFALGQKAKWCQSDPGPELLRSLSGLGAPKECYVLSEDQAWDGRIGLLKDVVQILSDQPVETSLVICLPSSLAYYYHGEMADLSGILTKGAS